MQASSMSAIASDASFRAWSAASSAPDVEGGTTDLI
jgi:hypothetical protein